jgi:biopolymer transport protein ExbD
MIRRNVVPSSIFRSVFFIGLVLISAKAQGVKVDLPRDLRNAVPDRAALSELAIVLAIPNETELYLNGKPIEKNSFGDAIHRLILGKSETQKVVYLACGASISYRVVVKILNVVRDQDIGQIGLMVYSAATPNVFPVEVPLPWKADEDISKLKPNPLTLLAEISSDQKLSLNHDTDGLGTDTLRLQRWLERLFEDRTRQHAYAIGMETRGDLPLAQRIEKTVFVKGALSLKYIDVLRVIDAVTGSGAHPVGLQIDALPE